MLSLREHSEAELTGKLRLKFKSLPPAMLAEVIADLKSSDLLSDQRFTEILIRSRTTRGYGPYYIRRELSAKGVAAGLIERQFDETGTDWLQVARELVERRHEHAGVNADAWARAVRFLQRRGFSGDLVSKAVGERPRENSDI